MAIADNWITDVDIKLFKGITSNLNTPKDLDPFIGEAQGFDVRQFMGESFYLALKAAFPGLAAPWDDLFNGSEYTYNGNQYEHEGIRAVLVYHSYARFLSNQGIISTPSGFREKSSQHSELASSSKMKLLITQARAGATAHEERVALFLDRNKIDFPLWKCDQRTTHYKKGVKFRAVG